MRKKSWDPIAELTRCYAEWNDCYENGGNDPTWYDGFRLNHLRRRILSSREEIKEKYEPCNYPDLYYIEVPPELPNEYMARADEIRKKAKESFSLYLQDENYLYLWEMVSSVPPKEAKRLCVKNVIGYVSGLELAILNDNLVTMRQHGKADTYLSAFASCAEKVRELMGKENIQSERIGIQMSPY